MDSKELKRRYQEGDRSFHKAQLQNANLTWLTLSDADFTAANFENANLISATLKDVNLSGAVLAFANLSRADLSNANLCGANLEGANLDGTTLSGAVYDLQTQFPLGFDPEASGAHLQAPPSDHVLTSEPNQLPPKNPKLANSDEEFLAQGYDYTLRPSHFSQLSPVVSEPWHDIVQNYNLSPQILENYIVERVSESEESIFNRRKNSTVAILLKPTKNHSYWIFEGEDHNYWLTPKSDLKVTSIGFDTFQALFECPEYPQGAKIQIIKPAKVAYSSASNCWNLLEKGQVLFSPRSLSIPQAESSSGEVLKLNIPEAPALELVQIPSGSFEMGSNEHETEKPIHTVTLKSFWMGRYPVTQEQYKAVMGNNPSHFKGDLNRPVEYVRWHDAITFCKKLSQQTGQTISLPSEAQWEYACRAGTASRYCYGDEESQLKDYACFIGNSNSQTHPVGERKPNSWGLYDMHGNVWEWCQDHWHGDYNGAPRDGDAWIDRGKNNNHPRLLRGGSWYGTSRNCRSANRVRNSADNRSDYFGFRVALSSGPGSS